MKRALLLFLGFAAVAFGQEDVITKAMRVEMARSMSGLRLENLAKPYFISYWIQDTSATTVSATLGQLTSSNSGRSRMLAVQVRVGNYGLDNTNFVSGRRPLGLRTLPLDDDYDQIRREIWLATDEEYKQAGTAFSSKMSALNGRSNPDLAVGDFTRQEPVTVNAPAKPLRIDVPALEKLARDVSAVFRGSPEILGSTVQITTTNATARLLDSEGTSARLEQPFVVVQVDARCQAADGSPVEDSFRIGGRTLDPLRSDTLLAETHALVDRLKALRTAPAFTYNGPVLFEGEAAAQALAQVLIPALSAVRIPIGSNPQVETQMRQVFDQFGVSLASRFGSRVLPLGIDITDNPLATEYAGVPLVGSRAVDIEGVPPRETKLVGNGWLIGLLATRAPTQQTPASTGSANAPGTAAPSNVFLTARKPMTAAQLHQELLRVAAERGTKCGLVIRHFGDTVLNGLLRLVNSRMSADNSGATVGAYLVCPDSHEQLVRAEIAPIPVTAFKDIVAAGDKPGVYNIASLLFVGAMTSGSPSTAWSSYIVPSLLFEELSLKPPTATALAPPVAPSPIAAGMK